jgi:hypothetical protein
MFIVARRGARHVIVTAFLGGAALCVLGPRSGSAQAASIPSSPVRAQPSQSDSVTITVLRAQNALLREYQQSLLSTVYWSLGGLGVIAGLLLGFGWFANFRVYERDKTALRQDLLGVIREENAKEQGRITQSLAESQRQLTERFTKLEEATVTAGKSAAEAVGQQLARTKASLEKQIVELELNLAEQEADKWRSEEVYTNELRVAVQMIKLAQTLERDFFVSRALDRVRASLRSGADPDADLSKELVATLGSLPPEYSTEVESLKAALRAVRT